MKDRRWVGRPWQRQPQETQKQWEAFECYLRQGPDRSLAETARQLHKSVSLIHRWSVRWAWEFRADQYDAVGSNAEAAAVERTVKRHATARGKAMVKVTNFVTASAVIASRRLFKRLRDHPDLVPGINGVSELVDLATRLQKLPGSAAADDLPQKVEEAVDIVSLELGRIRGRLIRAEEVSKGIPQSPSEADDGD